jgi:glutamate-1-semialdehyde aminotransferase
MGKPASGGAPLSAVAGIEDVGQNLPIAGWIEMSDRLSKKSEGQFWN